MALARIAKFQAASGDQAGAAKTFQNAVREAEATEDLVRSFQGPQGHTTTHVQSMGYFRATRLTDIAQAQAEAGEKAESKTTFEQAASEARGMPDPPPGKVNYGAFSKDFAFCLIAGAEARAGFVKEAFRTANAIRMLPGGPRQLGAEGMDLQAAALVEIAHAQGFAAETREALAWINALQAPATKANALLGLAKGLLERAGAEPPEGEPQSEI